MNNQNTTNKDLDREQFFKEQVFRTNVIPLIIWLFIILSLIYIPQYSRMPILSFTQLEVIILISMPFMFYGLIAIYELITGKIVGTDSDYINRIYQQFKEDKIKTDL